MQHEMPHLPPHEVAKQHCGFEMLTYTEAAYTSCGNELQPMYKRLLPVPYLQAWWW